MAIRCRRCDFPVTVPVAPVGLNPALVMTNVGWRYTAFDWTAEPEEVTQILPADPKRVMIGFGQGRSAQVVVAPQPKVLDGGWVLSNGATGQIPWFTLELMGPVICAEWYAQRLPQWFYVYEVFRLN